MQNDPSPANFQIVSDEYGNAAKTNQEKADLFANRLEKVHQEPKYDGFNEQWKQTVDNFISDNGDIYKNDVNSEYAATEEGDDSPLLESVSVAEIKKNLEKCKAKSAMGIDGISYGLIKRIPDAYMQCVAKFFTSCLKLGHFPSVWKQAKVILIPKPGKDSRQAKNHRPISLLSCLGKVFERILARRLSSYMEQNKLFSNSQSGFRSNRMTTEQLLRLSEESHNSFKQKKITAALFLDAEAAFDKCWHNGIRFKLKKNLHLPHRFIRVLSSFLSDRSLSVFFRGCWSKQVQIKAGTPQGSPLSPLIYLIYVNDFPQEIVNLGLSLSQYADDTAMWHSAYTKQYACTMIQRGLNYLEGWCRRWRVKLNGEKSQLLLISRHNEKNPEPQCLQLFNDLIKPTQRARFLGVEFDDRLRFANHIEDIVGRANKRLNVLRVLSRAGTDCKTLIKLYKLYIRPLFEYGSAAFIAAPLEQCKKIQKTQNTAIRICLRLPSYLSTKLIHEAACLLMVDDRFKKVNKKLLTTMVSHNDHIKKLVHNRDTNSLSNTLSPIDMILN